MLDETLRTFIDCYVDSLLAWDVILYLYNSPFNRGTVNELAEHLGRPPREINQVLKRLRDQGLVGIDGELETDYILSYNFKKQVEPFIVALNQRQLRLAILAKVLQREFAANEQFPV